MLKTASYNNDDDDECIQEYCISVLKMQKICKKEPADCNEKRDRTSEEPRDRDELPVSIFLRLESIL